MPRILFEGLLLMSFLSVSAQSLNKQVKTIFNQAEGILLYNEDYEEALPLFRMLTDLVPDNHNYQYKVGICYLNIPGKIREALHWLKRANVDPVIDYSYSYKESHPPVDVLFYIGSAHHMLGETDSAVVYYNEFLRATSRYRNTGMFYNEFVRQQIKNCEHARLMEKEPVRVRKEVLPNNINAYHKNLYPVMSGNRQVLVYTAYPGSNHRIMYSRRKGEGWSDPVDITDELEAGEDCYATSLSFTGDTLFIYKEEAGQADLWMSRHTGGHWTAMKRLGRNINTKYWESSCSMTADGKWLYFTSNRDGGYGGLDIYVAPRLPDGRWGEARNLGPVINTPLMEDSPYLSSDGKKLFFTSQGHYNMGGFDIFYSVRKGNRWTKPVNLGYPVNTTDVNRYYYPLGNGDTALVSLFTPEGNAGNWNIYKVHILSEGETYQVKLEGTLLFSDGATTPDSSLRVDVIDTTGKRIALLRPDSTGHYACTVTPGTYTLRFSSLRYRDTSETVTIPVNYPKPSLLVETRLMPAAAGKGDLFFVRSLYFPPGKDELTPELRIALTELAVMLQEYPSLKFEISGLADTSEATARSQRLPVRRAITVLNFLDSLGIPRDRVTFMKIGEVKVVPLGKGKVTSLSAMDEMTRRIDIKLIRPDTTLKLRKEFFVPEYVTGRDKLTYSILVIKTKKKLPADYFYRYNIEELSFVKVDEVNGEYYYTLGSYKQKNRAVEMLNRIIQAGFRSARLIDDPALDELLDRSPAEREFIGRSMYVKDEIPWYTIQIYALYHSPHKGAFRGLTDVKVWACKDRFVRYTTGNYHGYSKALADLPKIRKMGFHDAFIRPVSSLEELLKKEE